MSRNQSLVRPASPHARATLFALTIAAAALGGGARADQPDPRSQDLQIFFDTAGHI